jgi:hypothetical protein
MCNFTDDNDTLMQLVDLMAKNAPTVAYVNFY